MDGKSGARHAGAKGRVERVQRRELPRVGGLAASDGAR